MLDTGDALATGEIEHGGGEVHTPAVAVPRVPRESDLRPAALAGVPERAERARQIFHEAVDRGHRTGPLQELQRLPGPRQHRLGNFFGLSTAAHECLAGFAVVHKELPHRVEPGEHYLVAVMPERRQRIADFALRDEGQRA